MSEFEQESWQPSFDEAKAKEIIGKSLLVGITYRNRNEDILSYEQFHGEIVRASQDDGIIVQIHDSTTERWVPPDTSRLELAPLGEYRLKSTGEVVTNPDFLSTWTVYPKEDSGDTNDV